MGVRKTIAEESKNIHGARVRKTRQAVERETEHSYCRRVYRDDRAFAGEAKREAMSFKETP
jgi:hypothetical protein